MAELVVAVATPHNPLLWRTMRDPVPADLEQVAANFAMARDVVKDSGVEVLVVVGTDHMRQFFADNSPAFTVGKAANYPCTWENETRTFGMEYFEVTGHPELADAIAGRSVLPDAIDFATSRDWRLDHGFGLPLQYVTPNLDIPIVPINTNGTMPPLPGPRRYVELGRHLRRSIEAWESGTRVGLLTSGHLSTDIGGPRQFLGGEPVDADFDREAVSWMQAGDVDAAIEGCRFDRMMAAGNMTYQYINVLTALAAMDCRPADFAEATRSRYAASPFFIWQAS